eukprot:4453395-Ditylum_brightwellii.AAC.1
MKSGVRLRIVVTYLEQLSFKLSEIDVIFKNGMLRGVVPKLQKQMILRAIFTQVVRTGSRLKLEDMDIQVFKHGNRLRTM